MLLKVKNSGVPSATNSSSIAPSSNTHAATTWRKNISCDSLSLHSPWVHGSNNQSQVKYSKLEKVWSNKRE